MRRSIKRVERIIREMEQLNTEEQAILKAELDRRWNNTTKAGAPPQPLQTETS